MLWTNLCLGDRTLPVVDRIDSRTLFSWNMWGVTPWFFDSLYSMCMLLELLESGSSTPAWVIYHPWIPIAGWDPSPPRCLQGSPRARCPVRAWSPGSWWCSIPHSWHCLGNPQESPRKSPCVSPSRCFFELSADDVSAIADMVGPWLTSHADVGDGGGAPLGTVA